MHTTKTANMRKAILLFQHKGYNRGQQYNHLGKKYHVEVYWYAYITQQITSGRCIQQYIGSVGMVACNSKAKLMLNNRW